MLIFFELEQRKSSDQTIFKWHMDCAGGELGHGGSHQDSFSEWLARVGLQSISEDMLPKLQVHFTHLHPHLVMGPDGILDYFAVSARAGIPLSRSLHPAHSPTTAPPPFVPARSFCTTRPVRAGS